LASESSQTEPKKKSRRLYAVFVAVALLVAVFSSYRILGSHVEPITGPGPIDIEVTADKPFYLQGEEVNFTIYVNNPQDWPVEHPFNVNYQMGNESVDTCIDYVPGLQPSFPAHSRTMFGTFPWILESESGSNITLLEPGNYTFTVSFGGRVDYGDSGNCTFEVRLNPET
jgi:hypothetical protein